jgi:hypothetical protein
MEKLKPAAVSKTKIDNEIVADVPLVQRRRVTYVFNAVTSDSLSIPYAVSVNGVVPVMFRDKPKRVAGSGGKIEVNVPLGARVAIFLNSDAHPDYRKFPVYLVVVGDHDVLVHIDEKPGKHQDSDALAKITDAKVDREVYRGYLTGDTWMKVSHKYVSGEVDGLMPDNTRSEVVEAVKQIFNVLEKPNLEINTTLQKLGKRKLRVEFLDGENPRENINSGYSLLGEGLTRAHPAGYAAIFNSALETGVDRLVLTSAWRPMKGTISHRAGLGLDVNFVGTIRLNRQELQMKNVIDTPNVSDEEKRLFSEFKSLREAQEKAKDQLNKANNKIKYISENDEELLAAKQAQKKAHADYTSLDEKRKNAEVAWNNERDKNEPAEIRNFRSSLMRCRVISQILDPWFMDYNTSDQINGVPNLQVTKDERTHAHHLHITVKDSKIL